MRPAQLGGSVDVTMIDCRWLGRGGPGRVTEHLLRGLTATPPDGRWLLWGAVPDDLRWPGAECLMAPHDPHDWYGQRSLRSSPLPAGPRSGRHDAVIWPHQYRPLRRFAAHEVGIIHDTIPLRWGGGPAVRIARRAFLRRVASLSDRVITVSDYARRTIMADLGVGRDRIDVIELPADAACIDRVSRRRKETVDRPHVLFVGRFAPHKNLDRLVEAFPMTEFASRGGRLVVVGGVGRETDLLARRAGSSIDVREFCPQDELESLLATAAALVQPSLEEGYGLPLAEALAAGVPAAAADAGSLPEVSAGRASLFDPYDTSSIARAIDEAVAMGEAPPGQAATVSSTPEAFARSVMSSLDRAVSGRPTEPPR